MDILRSIAFKPNLTLTGAEDGFANSRILFKNSYE